MARPFTPSPLLMARPLWEEFYFASSHNKNVEFIHDSNIDKSEKTVMY